MFSRLSMMFFCAAVLAGCASKPQLAVPLAATTFTTAPNRIGVALNVLPAVDTNFPGANCLLCLAAASVANSDLTTYTKTLPYEDLPNLNQQIATVLQKKGLDVVVIDKINLKGLPDAGSGELNFAKKDFSTIKAKYKIDKLLVIDIAMVGIERPYATYVPTSDPKAKLTGSAYIVNLNNNAYEWYLPLQVVKSSDGKWDEPPKFPGLTNAYFQVLEITKDKIVAQLSH